MTIFKEGEVAVLATVAHIPMDSFEVDQVFKAILLGLYRLVVSRQSRFY